MNRSKRSARSRREPPTPPEFLVDRNFGKTVPLRLAELGWRLHLVAEVFPHDGMHTEDETWVEHAFVNGWMPLCKDGRIKGRDHEREPVERHRGVLFYLNNQQLLVADMVQWIHQAQALIYRACQRPGPACYAITRHGIDRTWPDE